MTREEKIAKIIGIIVAAPMDVLNRLEETVLSKSASNENAKDRDTRLVSISGAGRLLGISRSTVYTLVKTGRLDIVDLNGSSKVTMQSVFEFSDGKRPVNEKTAELIANHSRRD